MIIKEIVHAECKNIDFNYDKFKSHIEICKKDINSLDSKGNTPLHYFCQNNRVNIDGLKYFVENGANLNIKNKKKEIPLHFLIKNINVSLIMLEYMIEKKSDLNIENVNKQTPLHQACSNNNIKFDVIKHLIESKSKFDSIDDNGNMPAHIYANHKKFKADIFKILIEEKVISKEKGNGKSIMNNLCSNENISMDALKYMVEAKVDLGKKNISENTSLQYLCRNKGVTLEMVKYLVESKSDVHNINKFGDNLMHYVCQNENIDEGIIEYLLEQKCKLIVNKKNETPLLIACLNENVGEGILKKLAIKEHLDIKDKHGNYPLFFRASTTRNVSLEMIKTLLGEDKSVFTDYDKLSEILCENKCTDLEMVKFFIENKTDLNKKNGYTLYEDIIYDTSKYNKDHMRPSLDPHIIEYFYDKFKVEEGLTKEASLLELVCFTEKINLDVLKFLHSKNPSEWESTGSNGSSPIDYIAISDKVTLEMVKFVCGIKETIPIEIFGSFLFSLCNNPLISKDIVDYVLENFKELTNVLFSTFLRKEPLNKDMIKHLINNKASFTEKVKTSFPENSSRKAPFISLCENESVDLELIQLFVENEATELTHELFKHKILKPDLVKYLIENNSPLDFTSSSPLYSNTSLNLEHLRSFYENEKLEKEQKVSILKNVCSKDYFSIGLKEYLIKNNAVEDLTDLLVSCFKKPPRRQNYRKLDVKLIKCLVDNKADIDHITIEKRKTLLQLVCEYNDKRCLDVVKHFVESKIYIRSGEDESPLHLALEYQKNVHINELVLYLVEAGVNANEIDYNHNLPFHLAARNSFVSLRTLKYLAERTDDINKQDSIGYTALSLYLYPKEPNPPNFDYIKFFVELKMDLSLKNNFNKDALFMNCTFKKTLNISLDTIKYYVENKCDVLGVSSKGDNLLHSFLKLKVIDKNIINYLIESKVNLNLKNETNLSPIASYCSRKTRTPDVSLLTFFLENKASLKDETKFVSQIKVDNKPLLYLLLCQTDILFKNSSRCPEVFKNIFNEYLVGAHWNYSSHIFFPQYFKDKVFFFLLSLRWCVKNNIRQIFPKPLIVSIFQFATSPDYSMDDAVEINLYNTSNN